MTAVDIKGLIYSCLCTLWDRDGWTINSQHSLKASPVTI